MECPHCNTEVDTNNNFCRKCGKAVNLSEEPTKQLPKSDPAITNTLSGISLKEIFRSGIKYLLYLVLLTVIVHFVTVFLALSLKETISVGHQDDLSIYIIQAVISGMFILVLFTPIGISLKENILETDFARRSFHQFLKGWTIVWITWFLLYLYIALILGLAKYFEIQNVVVQTTVDFLNAATSATFFYIFLVLDKPRISAKTDVEWDRDFKISFRIIVLISLAIGIFAGLGRFDPETFDLGVYVSGIFAAISMAYVFGRLDSHYMRVNRWILAPLYLYASIQVVGPKLVDFSQPSHNDIYKWAFFAMVLILKIILFVVVNYWLQTGAFGRYFNTASSR